MIEEESINALDKKKVKLKTPDISRELKKEEDLTKLPSSLEDINKNPILKPLLDYVNATKQYEEEDERETNYLNDKLADLNELLDTGIYEDSQIAKMYKNIFEIYARLLWIYARNVDMANQKIVEMKKIVEKYYVKKEEKEDDTKKM